MAMTMAVAMVMVRDAVEVCLASFTHRLLFFSHGKVKDSAMQSGVKVSSVSSEFSECSECSDFSEEKITYYNAPTRRCVRMREMQGAEDEAEGSIYVICDRSRVPIATQQIVRYNAPTR